MALGDAQIERYSRQIIVSRVGGRAQERLLASHILVVGTLDAIADPLAYLAGAGVGTIHLMVADEASGISALMERMRDLNSDVDLKTTSTPADRVDLIFTIASDRHSLAAARALPGRILCRPHVFVRLDVPARMTVLPSPPPCLQCVADDDLLAPIESPASNPGFVSMAAAVEALKILAGYEPAPQPSIIRFDGYASAAHRAATRAEGRGVRCACGDGQ